MELTSPQGLFVGLTTLDLIYHAPLAPRPNEKIVAQSMTFAAGGPATNAAIAFAALGGEATLLSAVGQHPLSQMIRADLLQYGVHHMDLMPQRDDPPTVSSAIVSTETGDRAVVSRNAQGHQITDALALTHPLSSLLKSTDIILLDGHQMALSQLIATEAHEQTIPTVFDAGSWKDGSTTLLPKLTHIICSEAFRAPNCGNELETLQYLRSLNPKATLAITHGAAPITFDTPSQTGCCPCPSIPVVDTLGAGDFFHGAFAYWISRMSFEASIRAASVIASLSCQFPGTRDWLSKISEKHYP